MTDAAPIKVAVVGHTNTGKTSLLRTLARDVEFGEVSDRPAVTRHVEGKLLLVEGEPMLELYDTPGLEDSCGLLDHLEALATAAGGARRPDALDVLQGFLESPEAAGPFGQEAKALRQVLACDAALYVIDARDRVLGKHRDELEILSRCARPVVPVLNFTASDEARSEAWREQLSRLGLHAVAEFDTVVLDEQGERRLYEKMQSLLDRHRAVFTRLIDDRQAERERLVRAATRLLADMLIDAAAFVLVVRAGGGEGEAGGAEARSETAAATGRALDAMRDGLRRREEQCLHQLLELFAFREDDGRLEALSIVGGHWGLDLFSPEAVKKFGVRAGGAAAVGAMAGLAVDAMSAGITMGAATATGAAIGALLEAGRSYGRRLVGRARGFTELRCDDRTLLLLATRQLAVIEALRHRGHAAMQPFEVGPGGETAVAGADGQVGTGRDRGRGDGDRGQPAPWRRLPAPLRDARTNARWSMLTREAATDGVGLSAAADDARAEAEEDLALALLRQVAGTGGRG
jgi:GTPase Era involved in 16S rRNA processing